MTENLNLTHVAMLFSHPDMPAYAKLQDREADGNPNAGIDAKTMRGLIMADIESKQTGRANYTFAEFDAAVARIRNSRE